LATTPISSRPVLAANRFHSGNLSLVKEYKKDTPSTNMGIACHYRIYAATLKFGVTNPVATPMVLR